MIPRLPDRVRVYHTGTAGTSPEPWNRELQPELRAAISNMPNSKALEGNVLGRWEGLATHQARVEPHPALVANALLYDAMTQTHYLILGTPQKSNKHNAQGEPDTVICSLSVQKPKPSVS